MTDKERLVGLLRTSSHELTSRCVGDCGECADKIADYILADGWVRQSCKVGETVYYFSRSPLNLSVQPNTVYEATVVRIVTTSLGTSLVIQIHNEYGCTEIPDVNKWNEEVFASREEAEKTIKGDIKKMSYTSLWEIDKNWSGKEYTEYKNAWLFPPVVWDILMCKYIQRHERTDMFRTHTSYMSWCGFSTQSKERHRMLNERINNSEIQYDRVLWELSSLSVFNTKDKEFVADCIEEFVTNNFEYYDTEDCDHIKERFREIASDIRGLPRRCKYFVIHPTSIDDNVEYWFYRKRLSSWDKFVCEFTLIEDNKVIGFSDNLKMCKAVRNE